MRFFVPVTVDSRLYIYKYFKNSYYYEFDDYLTGVMV